MRNLTIIFLLTIALSLSLSCQKDKILSMHFNETGCANPWSQDPDIHVSNADPNYQSKVKEFLDLKGINTLTISLTNDGPLSGCFSCLCTTGRRINITIKEKDKSLAINLGFVQD